VLLHFGTSSLYARSQQKKRFINASYLKNNLLIKLNLYIIFYRMVTLEMSYT